MKRIIYVLLPVMLLTGCSSEEHVIEKSVSGTEAAVNEQELTEEETGEAKEAAELKGYCFVCQENEIYVDEDMAVVLEAIGEADSYYEAASCAYENELDKTYTYQGFQITTYPQGDQDLISCILLQDDTVETAEGIRIGDDRSAVVAAYGQDYTEDGTMLVYEKDGMKLGFILSLGTVSSIQYLSTALEG